MEEDVILILGEIIDNPEITKTINKDTNVATDIGIDSLRMISFILKIEEKLNIYIDFDKFSYDHLSSVEKFAKFLELCEKVDLIA